jgi:RND superfamily putative drug exporter
LPRPTGAATAPRSSRSSRLQDANSAAGRATLDRIRATEIAGVTVGGEAAQSADFLHAVYGNFPLMILAISVLTFILLARAFRSIVLPLKAVLLNLLSVAAAWGLTVLVWQDGYGSNAIWDIPPHKRSTSKCRS